MTSGKRWRTGVEVTGINEILVNNITSKKRINFLI
jgi:hypothetical protein